MGNPGLDTPIPPSQSSNIVFPNIYIFHLVYECKLEIGDGKDVRETKIGLQTGDDCIRACIDLKKTDDTVDGVTVYANNEPGSYY